MAALPDDLMLLAGNVDSAEATSCTGIGKFHRCPLMSAWLDFSPLFERSDLIVVIMI